MLFSDASFIGVDTTAGRVPFAYAALDNGLKLLALGQSDMEEVLAFIGGQSKALVAVCAPQSPNQGLMRRQEYRAQLSPPPRPGRWHNVRVAEYMLRQHNIRIPQTREQEDQCPSWVQVGFKFYRRLVRLDYHPYPAGEHLRQYIEVYPHASYATLLERCPFSKHSLIGRIQRQLVLYNQHINVSDPMLFFEEVTSYRLLNGVIPDENLYSPGELDALVAAYTAWTAATTPSHITQIGDPQEGTITVPVPELKGKYETQ